MIFLLVVKSKKLEKSYQRMFYKRSPAPQWAGNDLNNVFTQTTGKDSFPSVPSLTEEVVSMSTYEEFMILLTACNLLIAILTFTHRK